MPKEKFLTTIFDKVFWKILKNPQKFFKETASRSHPKWYKVGIGINCRCHRKGSNSGTAKKSVAINWNSSIESHPPEQINRFNRELERICSTAQQPIKVHSKFEFQITHISLVDSIESLGEGILNIWLARICCFFEEQNLNETSELRNCLQYSKRRSQTESIESTESTVSTESTDGQTFQSKKCEVNRPKSSRMDFDLNLSLNQIRAKIVRIQTQSGS